MLEIKRLSDTEATILVEGAVASSVKLGIPMCIAVADEAGNLIQFKRMDGAKITSISIAIDKAFTAAGARNGTHVYNQLCQPGQPTFGIHITNGGHFSIIGGGLPLTYEGTVIGGIGISAGTAIQDQDVAQEAVDHFYAKTGLKAL